MIANTFSPLSQKEFNNCIDRLGPWGDISSNHNAIAVAVSGGADSLCLAVLASRWCSKLIAFIVDHQLRPTSTVEAHQTQAILKNLSIPSIIITLTGLNTHSRLEEKARIARYEALIKTCQAYGCIDLLLGHHAGDQAETILMRCRSKSYSLGLSGMANVLELPTVRLVRPLLHINPQRLRMTLRRESIRWIEDKSNQDLRFQRNQLRKELSSEWETDRKVSTLLEKSQLYSHQRRIKNENQARKVLHHLFIHSCGFAVIRLSAFDNEILGALLRTLSGSIYKPSQKKIIRIFSQPMGCVCHGLRIIPLNSFGKALCIFREEACVEGAKAAVADCSWDKRFRIVIPNQSYNNDIKIGPLRSAYASHVPARMLPTAILRVIPAFWRNEKVVAIPSLNIYNDKTLQNWKILFQPNVPFTESYLF